MRLFRHGDTLNTNPSSHLTISQAAKLVATSRPKINFPDPPTKVKVTFSQKVLPPMKIKVRFLPFVTERPVDSPARLVEGEGDGIEDIEERDEDRPPPISETLKVLVHCWNRASQDDRQAFLAALTGTDDISIGVLRVSQIGLTAC